MNWTNYIRFSLAWPRPHLASREQQSYRLGKPFPISYSILPFPQSQISLSSRPASSSSHIRASSTTHAATPCEPTFFHAPAVLNYHNAFIESIVIFKSFCSSPCPTLIPSKVAHEPATPTSLRPHSGLRPHPLGIPLEVNTFS